MATDFQLTKRIFMLLFFYCILPIGVWGQWIVINTGNSRAIFDIQFADSNTVYATGDSVFFKSVDGGHNWKNLSPAIGKLTYPSFEGLHFLNKDTGFVYRIDINGDPTILKTTDGGQSWINSSSPNLSQGVSDMFFVNKEIGYASGGVGAGNAFCKTINGGLSWQSLTPPSINVSESIYFINDSLGFSGNGSIEKTNTGGLQWNYTLGYTIGEKVVDYRFFDRKMGIAITENWYVYKTVDSGNNWSMISTPYSSGVMCNGMAFTDDRTGYATGLARIYPLLTTDGGNTWKIDNTYPGAYKQTCISAWKDKVIIGALSGEVVLREKSLDVQIAERKEPVVTVFPNPTNRSICISSSQGSILSVKILDLTGKIVYERQFSGKQTSFTTDLTELSKGSYIVEVKGEGGVATKKILLQ